MKTCTACGESKPLSDYYADKGKPRSNCKECHKTNVYARRDANPEIHAARLASYRERNREKLAADTRVWLAANRDEINARRRERIAARTQAKIDAIRRENEIPLTTKALEVRAYSKVDPEDYERLSELRWHLSKGYALNADVGPMHRLILGLPARKEDPREVDHINRDRLDNRKANLRIVTSAQNRQNSTKREGTSSRYRGVAWQKKSRKWQAYYTIDRHMVYLGLFETEAQAAQASQQARLDHMSHATD